MVKFDVDQIYEQYASQIDAIVQIMDFSYRKSAKIISWLYGGSDETWRKFLSSKKPKTIPKEVEEMLQKFKNSK